MGTSKATVKIPLRIAIAQLNAIVGDLEGNGRKIIKFIEDAIIHRADIIIFPELAVCGYPPEDLLLKRHFVDDNLRVLKSIAKRTVGITTIVGFVHRDKAGDLYNAAGVIQDKKLKGIYYKMHLPNYGVFDEKRYFSPGYENKIFVSGKCIFGITICEDIWMINGPSKLQHDAGAKLLINISSSPYHAGKEFERRKMLHQRANQCKSFVCYANLVGGQDELVFDGASLVLDPKGRIIACGSQFEEDLVFADLNLDSISRRKVSASARKKLRVLPLSSMESSEKKPPLGKRKPRRLSRLGEIYSALVLGTRDYVKKNGFEKVVIGVSGGIDSALTALIACDALGKDNVIGISMPSRYSSSGTQLDTKILASKLGIRLIVVPINNVYKTYLSSLEKNFRQLRADITEENLQARIRGNILMAFSNKFGWLVLTTGNKSETSVGYCTLYGDMAGGFAVLKDVPKTLVYELAQFRNGKGKDVIPRSIFTREPSAELRKGQKDTDALPPYNVLDPILKAYVEEDKSFDDLVGSRSKKFNPKVVRRVILMVDRNEYKRRQAPPGVKITPKAFGKDRRLPITNKYKVC